MDTRQQECGSPHERSRSLYTFEHLKKNHIFLAISEKCSYSTFQHAYSLLPCDHSLKPLCCFSFCLLPFNYPSFNLRALSLVLILVLLYIFLLAIYV